jgi:hypothetical protein
MGDGSRKRHLGAARPALLIALSVGTPAGAAPAPAPPTVTATRPQDRVIFKADATRKLFPRGVTGAVWTPTLTDVLALEEKLPAYLREHYESLGEPDKSRPKEPLWKRAPGSRFRTPPLWNRAPGYKRQYFGFTRQGERVVFANFFCHATRGDHWKTDEVGYMDGGDCYFNVRYDPKLGVFYDFIVNGDR